MNKDNDQCHYSNEIQATLFGYWGIFSTIYKLIYLTYFLLNGLKRGNAVIKSLYT